MTLQGSDEAAGGAEPSVQTLDFQAAERTTVLSEPAIAAVRRNHLDAKLFGQLAVEPVAVGGLVADQVLGQFIQKYGRQGGPCQTAFVWRGRLDGDGQRESALGGADRKPFLASAKVASMNSPPVSGCPVRAIPGSGGAAPVPAYLPAPNAKSHRAQSGRGRT